MCYGLNIYCNNISINSSYFFSILKQFQYAQALNIYIAICRKNVTGIMDYMKDA